MKLQGKKILVTGGTSGIGLGVLEWALREKAVVSTLGLASEVARFKEMHPTVTSYACDLSNSTEIIDVFKQIEKDFDSIDILINNAGIVFNSPLLRLTPQGFLPHDFAEWEKVIAVNLNAVFYTTALAVAAMVKKRVKGLVINISSICANGNSGQGAYSASKAGVESATRAWAKELGAYGIRVAAIAPGFIDTPKTQEIMEEHVKTNWQKKTPLSRFGDVNEIVQGVSFIVENDFFNGKVLQIDGGLTI